MELRRAGILNAGLLLLLSTATGGTGEEPALSLVEHWENGQRIYMSGITAQGRVVQNSHGMEGSVDPRGNELNGRKRPAYNEETVKAAIVAGIDSGGNKLHPEMPRWTGLTARDLDDLIGFLKTLGAFHQGSPDRSRGL